MANGRRGGRGRNRGRGAEGPNPQGSKTSFAQSGGKNTTFGNGSGSGTAFGSKAQRGKTLGSGGLRANNTYRIREAGGDAALVPGRARAAKGKNLPQGPKPSVGGPSMFDHKKITVKQPPRGGH